jgi:SAM-dependent methyltransferase
MGGPPEFGGFSDVDATGEPGGYAGYLDAVRDVGAVAEWKERSFALLEPRPGAVLLDVGCGTGDDVRALTARLAPGGRAIGIDASAAMIDEARRRGTAGGVELRVGDATRLDLPDDTVDGARTERTLQHLERPEAAVAELARVVRPGGRVVLAEPDWGTLVVDPGDPALVGALARSAAERVRSGTVGRRLRGMLVAAGLADVGVAARALLVTDVVRSRLLFDLDGALERAVAAGRVARGDADSWRSDFDRAAEEGCHLVAMTAFMAWGRLPLRPRARRSSTLAARQHLTDQGW